MTEDKVAVVDVVLEAKAGGIEAIWTYRAEGSISVGDAVLAPLGSRVVVGYVLRSYPAGEAELGFPISKLRRVQDRIEGLSLPLQLTSLLEFVSRTYLCPLPAAIGAAAPPGVGDRITTTWSLMGAGGDHELSTLQRETLATIADSGGNLVESKAKKLPPQTKRVLRILVGKGLVAEKREALPLPTPKAEQAMLRLCPDEAKLERFLAKEGKRKPAQALTIMKLQTAEEPALTRDEIRALCGVTDQTLRSLVVAGLLQPVEGRDQAAKKPPTPNAEQAAAIEAIVAAVEAKRPERFLLYGVTGSGKTEVFLRSAAAALATGRQVLYLVPEIALATQAIAQLRDRFGDRVAVLHSDLSAGRRLDHWLRVRSGAAPLVLGARSALFAPLSNLGLIVVDEEHEGSYKQDTSPRYHAKALALKLSDLHECPVVLGSATPSAESFFEAKSGELTLLELPSRAAAARMPTVIVDDLRAGYSAGRPSILAAELHDRIGQTLERSEQVILFLNRRAYSPFLICRDCGMQFRCPRCSVALSFSRQQRRLRCHHCDYHQPPPDACPKCGGIRLSPLGIGTEKVEEAVAADFPHAAVARLDRDISRRKGAVEEILARFRSGEIQILVGTQIVAKGLDFPNVTLVGVIAADVSLNLPDFRASERTFQLLSQVGGRAGRGHAPGFVVVQTFNPDHVSVTAARDHDYERLFNSLIEERRLVGYPPFRRLVNVLFSGEDLAQVRQVSAEAASRLTAIQGAEVLGPVDAAIERLQNRWRRHVLVKLPPGAPPGPVGEALAGFKPKGVAISVDVDPYSLL